MSPREPAGAGAAIDAALTRLEDDQVLVGIVGADASASSDLTRVMRSGWEFSAVGPKRTRS